MHAALLTIVAVLSIAVHVPVQLPMHVPSQWTCGSVPGTHAPVQLASQDPWH
jgi:hypothetical protein